jgi:hypothetical protein
MYDAHDRVGRLLYPWIGDVFDADITRTMKDGCSHERRG